MFENRELKVWHGLSGRKGGVKEPEAGAARTTDAGA